MKKRSIVILVIVIVVLSSVALLINYEYYSPFHNKWEKNIPGSIYEGQIIGNTAYILATSASYSNYYSNYTSHLYKVNLITGKYEWTSSAINTTGFYSTYTLPSQKGPDMYIFNGTVYLATFNGTKDTQLINFARTGNFVVWAINSTTGKTEFSENLVPGGLRNLNSLGYSAVFSGDRLDLGYIMGAFSSGSLNSTFQVDSYDIGSHGLYLEYGNNTSMEAPAGWGSGSEIVQSSGDYVSYTVNGINKTFVYDSASGSLSTFNLSDRVQGFVGTDLYTSSTENSTLFINDTNVLNGETHNFINITLPGISIDSYGYSLVITPAHVVALETQDSGIGVSNLDGSPLVQNNIRFMGFLPSGTILWNRTIAPDPYGTFTQMSYNGNGIILLTTMPGAYSNDYSYHSNLVAINCSSGHTVLNKFYRYYVNFMSGDNAEFYSPPAFNGVVAYGGGFLIYKLGNKIACAYL